MRYGITLAALAVLLVDSPIFAYTIIAVEQGYVTVQADNKPRWNNKAQNKQYFEIDEDKKTVTRIKVEYLVDTFSYKKGHIEPDDTIYRIFGPSVDTKFMAAGKVIHAVGEPGTNAVELISIGKDYVLQSLSAGDYMTVSKSKIVETINTK